MLNIHEYSQAGNVTNRIFNKSKMRKLRSFLTEEDSTYESRGNKHEEMWWAYLKMRNGNTTNVDSSKGESARLSNGCNSCVRRGLKVKYLHETDRACNGLTCHNKLKDQWGDRIIGWKLTSLDMVYS